MTLIIIVVRLHACNTPGEDPEGVQTKPPGHLRLHIVCAYLAWSNNDFWPAEPHPDESTS